MSRQGKENNENKLTQLGRRRILDAYFQPPILNGKTESVYSRAPFCLYIRRHRFSSQKSRTVSSMME